MNKTHHFVRFAALLLLSTLAQAQIAPDYIRHPVSVCTSHQYLQYTATSGTPATCSQVAYADVTGTPTIPTVTGGTCTNQVVTAISGSAVPTCNSIVNAYIANSTIDLTTKVTGVLPIANIATGTPTGSKFVRDDGTLAVPSGGAVTSVFGRTGAVTAQTGDYTPTQVGLGNVTNDAQTKAAVVPNTAPSAGQILVGNAGGTAYAPVSVSGDLTCASTGVCTVANNAIGVSKIAQAAAHTIPSNITGSTANLVNNALNPTIWNAEIGSTRGGIPFNGASIVQILSPGTLGQVLASGGPGADPTWTSLTGAFSGRTVPATGCFSSFGSSVTATNKTSPPRMQFSMAASAGTNLGGLTQASISAPYTIDLAFVNIANNVQSSVSSYVAITLADSGGTPKFRTYGLGGSTNTISWIVNSWTGTTSAAAVTTGQVGGQNTTFLRVTNDTTNIRFYLSNDGLSYSLVFTEAVNTFVTPTKFGIAALNQQSLAAKWDIFYWLVSSGILGDAS